MTNTLKYLIITFLVTSIFPAFSQQESIELFLSDSSMTHSSVSICIIEADNGDIVAEYDSGRSLTPASVMKLITSATALEMLGPAYTFKTVIGYTGTLNLRSGILLGDIVIKGGGDPTLGSEYFSDHYGNFTDNWISEINKLGIKKVEGRVIADDSYYDYLPVPSKWLWEDMGNYYGAGAYGLSVFDNTYEIHLKTSSNSTNPQITEILPDESYSNLSNWLVAEGTSDKGYVFAAPYGTNGWMAGSVPTNRDDFILKASISDPPLLLAKVISEKLRSSGIQVTQDATTSRLVKSGIPDDKIIPIAETISPPLIDIIEIMNHESVNLFAEHLIKELGKKYYNNGSTDAGIMAVSDFLTEAGIDTDGMYIADGSGLSPLAAINSRGLVNLLLYMKNQGKYFPEYYVSLPEAGKEGTLKYYFNDPAFNLRLKAKSGSMTRVRNYAGYITTSSGKELVFAIFTNNFSGSSTVIIKGIEELLKEIILSY